MTSVKIRALIRNMSSKKNIDSQILLRNYMLERLLERIANSKYKNKFILKGGMLIASMVGMDTRSTIDMDATIKNLALTKENLIKMLDGILAVSINDDVNINFLKIENIREDAQYEGYRITLEGIIDKTKVPIKLDITAGDKITPSAIKYHFNLLLEDRSINILAYNIETVLAEKLNSIISLSVKNTRMRDYYDIYILSKLQSDNINKQILKLAINATFIQRGTHELINNLNNILNKIQTSSDLEKLWNNYSKKNSYAANISWEEIIFELNEILNFVYK